MTVYTGNTPINVLTRIIKLNHIKARVYTWDMDRENSNNVLFIEYEM